MILLAIIIGDVYVVFEKKKELRRDKSQKGS